MADEWLRKKKRSRKKLQKKWFKFKGCWREVCKGTAVVDIRFCSICPLSEGPDLKCGHPCEGYKRGYMKIKFIREKDGKKV
jgi:hypothetical protein